MLFHTIYIKFGFGLSKLFRECVLRILWLHCKVLFPLLHKGAEGLLGQGGPTGTIGH